MEINDEMYVRAVLFEGRDNVMLEWLKAPEDLLLNAGGVVASWLAEKGTARFEVIQTIAATVVLVGLVSVIVYWQSIFGFLASRSRKRTLS